MSSHEALQLVALAINIGLWIVVGLYAHSLGRRWYVWMLVCLVCPTVLTLIILACCGMTKDKLILVNQPKAIEPPKPTQVEQDLRAVALVMQQKQLPAKTQWKIVAGMLVLIVLGVAATFAYASTIKPQHQVVTYQQHVTPHLPPLNLHGQSVPDTY
jgi:hypothetical protein